MITDWMNTNQMAQLEQMPLKSKIKLIVTVCEK